MNKKRHAQQLQNLVQQGIALHQGGKLAEAEQRYRSVLKLQPNNADALHFLGLLLHRLGKPADAITSVRQATVHAPEYVDAFNNLGNLLKLAGKFDEAEAAYRRSIALRPADANAHSNLGVVLKARGLLSEAEATLRKAIELDDRHVPAYTNLGHLLKRTGRMEEAISYYRAAIVFDPENPAAPHVLGLAYQANGEMENARGVFQAWLDRDPGNPVAMHMLQACSESAAPARASDAYVRTIFDDMADSFDEHLADLGYRAPQIIAEAVAHIWPQPNSELSILDAGCGTGLCGHFLRPLASTLTGIDLSSGMLRRAQALKLYDQLIEAELTAFLKAHSQTYDAVISADTLCYFGALDAMFGATAQALRPGGYLLFTVEKAPASAGYGYHLQSHGRYSHAPEYVRRELENAGFHVKALNDAELRMESGKPVQGLVVTAHHPNVS